MQKRIRILRGGVGGHYRRSLQKGGEIIFYLAEKLPHQYRPVDILVDQSGLWHVGGRPIVLSDLMHRVDTVWNVAHAHFSHSLDSLSVPHVGSAPFFASLQQSRELLAEHMQMTGISLPRSILLPVYQADFDLPSPRLRQGTAADQIKEYAIRKAQEVYKL